ncbi:integral membrane protein TerC family-domain-containing protein [Ochromonadaceae sp. CCMP2298]|nr:integral membrane protein TerC family-domain-containing protein [Ochromonadaceae sp. CCMP2298]|mmetsp:Transcript_30883/g.66502  ORF Transcript_30883/g.66502 Transcript_30883/m.66502 type:complete len:358 (+) Transcript_30883:71-1144(+)
MGSLFLMVIAMLASSWVGDAFGYSALPSRPSFQTLSVNSLSRLQRSSGSGVGSTDSVSSVSALRATKVDEVLEKGDTDLVDSTSGDLIRTAWWVAAAAGFSAVLAATQSTTVAIEFCSGYVLEQCLSVDNLFVILLIFKYFEVGRQDQAKALNWGIIGAVILRGLFITLGSVVLTQFKQVLLLFAGVLLVSSYKILFAGEEEEEDLADSPLIKFASKYLPVSEQKDGDNFFTLVNGVKMATPYLLCVVCIELSDIVFAFDSVPAIFGVTSDPLIVFSSNIFAIAGLRSLFGVLSNAVANLQYLEKAVGIILAVIAVKMGFEVFGVELLDPLQSLGVVMSLLVGGVGASLWAPKEEAE